MSKYEAAKEYDEAGWKVIPLYGIGEDGRCGCRRDDCKERNWGKHPVGNDWQRQERLTGADLVTHFMESGRNLGIATGEESGVWVLDLDDGGEETLAALEAEHGPLPETREHRTGGGGRHLIFAYPDVGTLAPILEEAEGREVLSVEIGNYAPIKHEGDEWTGLDSRGDGGQIVAPPSVSGKGTYEVVRDIDPVPAPEWLVLAVARVEYDYSDVVTTPDVDRSGHEYGDWLKEKREEFAERLRSIGEKDLWDHETWKVAADIAGYAKSEWCPLTLEEGRALLHEHAPLQPEPTDEHPTPWTTEDVEAKWKSAVRNADPMPPEPMPLFIPFPEGADEKWDAHPWTDIGNAYRLLDHFGDRLRWVETDRAWAVYEDGHWQRHRAGLRWAREMMERLPKTEAASYSGTPNDKGESPRSKFLKWVKGQSNVAPMKRALEAATSLPEMRVEVTDFDADPYLLNVKNGTIDLRTGALREHSHRDLLSKRIEVEYHPERTSAEWAAFLADTQPDAEVREFLRLVVGYSLTGSMVEQKFFIHHGQGANGKSVFLDVLHDVIGDYSMVMKRDTLTTAGAGGMAVDHARMPGKRFLSVSETGLGRRLDEEVVKGITGGDVQVGEAKYAAPFEFEPVGKIHYVTNHLPKLSDAASIWRRVVLVPWPVSFVEVPDPFDDMQKPLDPLLPERMESEHEAVLAWAVSGAVDWFSAGRLIVPEACVQARDQFQSDNDEFGRFIEDALVLDPEAVTESAAIFKAYEHWAEDNGIEAKPKRNWVTSQLTDRGLERARRRVPGKKSPARCIVGVSVHPDYAQFYRP